MGDREPTPKQTENREAGEVTPESLKNSADKLLTLIGLQGDAKPLLQQEKWKIWSRGAPPDIGGKEWLGLVDPLQNTITDEKKSPTFSNVVEYTFLHMMGDTTKLRDWSADDPLFQEVNLKKVYWVFDQALLSDYLSTIKQYSEYCAKNPDLPKGARNLEWEKKAAETMKMLEMTLPKVTLALRAFYVQNLAKNADKPTEKKKLEDFAKKLRGDLAGLAGKEEVTVKLQKGEVKIKVDEKISQENLASLCNKWMTDARKGESEDVPYEVDTSLTKTRLEEIAKEIGFKVGLGEGEIGPSTYRVRAAHAMYGKLLMAQTGHTVDQMFPKKIDGKRTPVQIEQINRLEKTLRSIDEQWQSYATNTVQFQLDCTSLLYLMGQMGPYLSQARVGLSEDDKKFYRDQMLPQNARDALSKEQPQMNIGQLVNYVSLIEKGLMSNLAKAEALDQFAESLEETVLFKIFADLDDLLIGGVKWSWKVPGAVAKLLGQTQLLPEDVQRVQRIQEFYDKLVEMRDNVRSARIKIAAAKDRLKAGAQSAKSALDDMKKSLDDPKRKVKNQDLVRVVKMNDEVMQVTTDLIILNKEITHLVNFHSVASSAYAEKQNLNWWTVPAGVAATDWMLGGWLGRGISRGAGWVGGKGTNLLVPVPILNKLAGSTVEWSLNLPGRVYQYTSPTYLAGKGLKMAANALAPNPEAEALILTKANSLLARAIHDAPLTEEQRIVLAEKAIVEHFKLKTPLTEAQRRAIWNAHEIKPSGPKGTWLLEDLRKKFEILNKANLKDEARFLIEHGFCGPRSGLEISQSLRNAGNAKLADELLRTIRSGEVPQAIQESMKVLKPKLAKSGTAAEQAFNRASSRCLDLGITDAKVFEQMMKDPVIFSVLSRTDEKVLPALSAAANDLPAMRRVASYISALGKEVDVALLDMKVIQALLKSDASAAGITRLVNAARAQQWFKAGGTKAADEIAKAFETMSRWQKAGNLTRGLYVAGAAVEGMMLVNDIVTYTEMRDRLNTTLRSLDTSLRQGGFVKQGDIYKHKQTGVEIELKQLEQNISSLSDPQLARIAADVGGASMLLAPSLALGPVGLVVAGVLIVVHVGITAFEQMKERDFMTNVPLPVLALISTQGTVGKSPHELIESYSNWNISDILYEADQSTQEKQQKYLIRKKSALIIFYQELASVVKQFPEFAPELVGDKDIAGLLDEKNGRLFLRDYEEIIRPYIALRLFQLSYDDDSKWSEFKKLRTSEGVFDSEKVSKEMMHMVIHEAVFVYLKHLRQGAYIETEQTVANTRKARKPSDKPMSDDFEIDARASASVADETSEAMLAARGEGMLFGNKISNLPSDGEKTLIQKILQDAEKKMDGVSGTRKEMRQRNSNLFAVSLPSGVLPERTKRDVDLSQLWLSGMEKGALFQTEKALKTVIERGKKITEDLKDVGTTSGAWFAQHEHFIRVRDYAALLSMYPEFDPGGSLRQKIDSLKRFPWRKAMDDRLMLLRVEDWAGERNDAFRAVLKAIETQLRRLELEKAKFVPLNREAQESRKFLLGSEESIWYSTAQEVFVVTDPNKPEGEKFLGVPGKNITHVLLSGTLTCSSKFEEIHGSKVPSFQWSFKPEKPGEKFYMYTKEVYGAQSMIYEGIRTQKLFKKNPADDYYQREGYEGKYYPQPNGTIFWTGGKIPSGETLPPKTYIDGEWRNVTEQFKGVESAGIWLEAVEHQIENATINPGESFRYFFEEDFKDGKEATDAALKIFVNITLAEPAIFKTSDGKEFKFTKIRGPLSVLSGHRYGSQVGITLEDGQEKVIAKKYYEQMFKKGQCFIKLSWPQKNLLEVQASDALTVKQYEFERSLGSPQFERKTVAVVQEVKGEPAKQTEQKLTKEILPMTPFSFESDAFDLVMTLKDGKVIQDSISPDDSKTLRSETTNYLMNYDRVSISGTERHKWVFTLPENVTSALLTDKKTQRSVEFKVKKQAKE